MERRRHQIDREAPSVGPIVCWAVVVIGIPLLVWLLTGEKHLW